MSLKVCLALVLAALSCPGGPAAAAGRGGPAGRAPATAQAPAATWARYTYPGDEFSVELPEMPAVSHTTRHIEGTRFDTEKVRVFSLYSGGVVFFVAAYDRPRKSESLDYFASFLRGMWEVSPKGEGAPLGGFEGRSYGVSGRPLRLVTNELYGEGRVFRTKKHAYLALAFSNEDGRPEVERFLDSLSLGPSPSGERVAEQEAVRPFAPPRTPAGGQGPAAGAGPTGAGAGEAQASSADGPFTAKELGQKARIVYKPEPDYTEEARRGNIRGAAKLRAVLSPDGKVRDISVIKGLPNGLTESAMRAARRMLFFPAAKDGRPVSQYVVLEYHFNIY